MKHDIRKYLPSCGNFEILRGNLRKVILQSLAKSADLLSAELLSFEADNAGYRYEVTDAVESYLLLSETYSRGRKIIFRRRAI